MYVIGTASASALTVDAHLGDERALLALAQPAAVALREDLDDLGADVVARAGVLLAGIPEADHQEIGGHASALVGAGLLGCASRALGPSPPSPLRSPSTLFALGRFGFLAEVHAARLHDLDDELVGVGDDRRRRRAPRGRATCTWSPMSSARDVVARSRAATSAGSASTEMANSVCSSSPPFFTPSASPSRWSGTSAATVWSARMRTKSTCSERALHRVALDLPGERELRRSPSICSVMTVFAPARRREDVLQLTRGTVTDIVSAPRP